MMMRRVAVLAVLMITTVASQVDVANALGQTGPDVTIPTLTVKPGAVLNLVTRKVRGVHRVKQLDTTQTVGSNGACTGNQNGSWDEGFGMQWAYRTDGTKIAYRKATGTHYCGSHVYSHHAHGTLIKGWSYEGDQVWSVYTSQCAQTTAENVSEIATCGSPDQDTQHGGKWYIIGGFYFDQDSPIDDYEVTWSCDGCIDTQYAVP
jgi:hypothetical protein